MSIGLMMQMHGSFKITKAGSTFVDYTRKFKRWFYFKTFQASGKNYFSLSLQIEFYIRAGTTTELAKRIERHSDSGN